jgi:hypothetical protein
MSPWNYPVSLVLAPIIAAVAAGNAIVVKPSELSANVSLELGRLCAKYLDNDAIRFIQGGVNTATAVLNQRFDFIKCVLLVRLRLFLLKYPGYSCLVIDACPASLALHERHCDTKGSNSSLDYFILNPTQSLCSPLLRYTGNSMVARIVHKAANKHLTPGLIMSVIAITRSPSVEKFIVTVLKVGESCHSFMHDQFSLSSEVRAPLSSPTRPIWARLPSVSCGASSA